MIGSSESKTLTFGSRATILFVRTFQWLMLVFTWAIFTKNFPAHMTQVIWCCALLGWEWFCWNMVQAQLDAEAITYRRWLGTVGVPWDSVQSATLFKGTGGIMIGVILRIEGRTFLTRYKFLVDAHPGIEILRRSPSVNDPAGLKQLREKLAGQI